VIPFWIGLLVGLVAGGVLGVLTVSLCIAARDAAPQKRDRAIRATPRGRHSPQIISRVKAPLGQYFGEYSPATPLRGRIGVYLVTRPWRK
jgi:uncharacterized membrane protein YedE/YeeE